MGLEIKILGALEVGGEGGPVDVRAPKQRELLAMLAMHHGEVVSRDRLVDALWGDSPPGSATKAVQVHVAQLRKAGVGIETRSPGYALTLEAGALDAELFESLAGNGTEALDAGDPERAAAGLRKALALWRGPPFADLAYAEFAQGEIARLGDLRLVALEARIGADLALGRHA